MDGIPERIAATGVRIGGVILWLSTALVLVQYMSYSIYQANWDLRSFCDWLLRFGSKLIKVA